MEMNPCETEKVVLLKIGFLLPVSFWLGGKVALARYDFQCIIVFNC